MLKPQIARYATTFFIALAIMIGTALGTAAWVWVLAQVHAACGDLAVAVFVLVGVCLTSALVAFLVSAAARALPDDYSIGEREGL